MFCHRPMRVALGAASASARTVSGARRPMTFPARNVTIVVPYAPGGIADTTARIVAPALEKDAGRSRS